MFHVLRKLADYESYQIFWEMCTTDKSENNASLAKQKIELVSFLTLEEAKEFCVSAMAETISLIRYVHKEDISKEPIDNWFKIIEIKQFHTVV
jgi:hypothetical protein